MRENKKKKNRENGEFNKHHGYRGIFYTEEIDEDATV